MHTLVNAALTLLLSLTPVLAAAGQIAVIGSTVNERVAAPGETYSGTIVVRNVSAKDQSVRVYQTDYLFHADGTSRFEAGGTAPRSNARWVVPARRSLLVPAGGNVALAYAVHVPASDSLVGTYWSAIMIEAVPNDAAASSGDRPRVGIGSILRYAVQVATHVQFTGSRKVAFSNARFVIDSAGARAFELDVANAGERAHRPVLWIELYDAHGALRAKARQERGLLYPGTSLRQTFALGSIAAGVYRAIVFADSGEDAVLASQYTLRF